MSKDACLLVVAMQSGLEWKQRHAAWSWRRRPRRRAAPQLPGVGGSPHPLRVFPQSAAGFHIVKHTTGLPIAGV